MSNPTPRTPAQVIAAVARALAIVENAASSPSINSAPTTETGLEWTEEQAMQMHNLLETLEETLEDFRG